MAGKGGVGKSTTSVAWALAQAERGKVLLIDHDGGHSLARVLAFEGREFESNKINYTGVENLYLAVVNELPFESIADRKNSKKTMREYSAQFPGDYGLLIFMDIIAKFFGAPTDISSTSKFLSIVNLYYQAEAKGIDHIIIDVEPTAGLERLLNWMGAVTRSLVNLRDSGWITLKTIGTAWPDVADFMKGDYIKNADVYTKRMTEVADAIRDANCVIVTIPESSPVAQAADVKKMITSFGGKVVGYVVNNIRNENHEHEQIAKILLQAGDMRVIQIGHNRNLCDSTPTHRRKSLREAGRAVLGVC